MTVYRNRGLNYIFYAWYCVYDIYESSTIELCTEVSLLRILSRDIQSSQTMGYTARVRFLVEISRVLFMTTMSDRTWDEAAYSPPPRAELKKESM
jgi:hypothetical protein